MMFTEIIMVYIEKHMKNTHTHTHTHTVSEMHKFIILQLLAHVETTVS